MGKKFFYKTGVDIANTKSMFNFLKNHNMYDTTNRWNQLKSIGHNVKLYNLCLDGDWENALVHLHDDDWFIVNRIIKDWEEVHPGYQVGFNGRNGGYLVLYNEHNYKNILPDWIVDYDDYEDFKQWVREYYSNRLSDINPELLKYVKIVRDFDKLCDELRTYVNDLSLQSVDSEN